MRISKLQIPSGQKGIDEIHLKKLGDVVALIGRNGSGKSRVLQVIEEYIQNLSIAELINRNIINLPESLNNQIEEEIKDILFNTNSKENVIAISHPERQSYKYEIERKVKYKKIFWGLINKYKKEVTQAYGSLYNFKEQYDIILKKVIKKITYSQIHNLQLKYESSIQEGKEALHTIPFEELINNAKNKHSTINEIDAIYSSGLTYMRRLPHELVNDKIQCFLDEKDFHETLSYKRFLSLKLYIKKFLNKDLDWGNSNDSGTRDDDGFQRNHQGYWKLNGRKFDYAELSDGEKTLFAYSLLFFLLDQNSEIPIKESIIFIDEPELHLHPESEITVIKSIREIIKDSGQLWIATHSLNILSSLNYNEIFLVKENKIYSPERHIPGKSFVELMGIDEYIEKMRHFVTNMSTWAYVNFIEQCFEKPDVIESANPNDPQLRAFKEALKLNSEPNVLLDFGAGKGRIYNSLIEQSEYDFTYCALEPDHIDAEYLRSLGIENVYETHTGLPNSYFNFIFLCNVLHEMKINEWKDNFNSIIDALNTNSYLIIIEDLLLPKGERINREGFIILDADSIQKLFQLESSPVQIIIDDNNYKDRILCVQIKKELIRPITHKSLKEAFEKRRDNVFSKIVSIREITNDSDLNDGEKLKHGREYAFYSQLYINLSFGIEWVENELKSKAK